MAGEVEFLRDLEAFLGGLNWVQVRYARIAAGGTVDLGVITDQRARLHVEVAARFGSGRVNIAAQPPTAQPREIAIEGWSGHRSESQITLVFYTGGAVTAPFVELLETAETVELRLLTMPMSPDSSPVFMSAWLAEIRVELARPIADREVRQPTGHSPAQYELRGVDFVDVRSGQPVHRRPKHRYGDAPIVPPTRQ